MNTEALKRLLREEFQRYFKKPIVMQRHLTTYQQTERILYSYEALKIKIAADKEELLSEPIHMPRRSCDVIKYSSGASFLAMEIQDKIEDKKRSMERTECQVRRIDNALDTIRNDEYYEIIEMKYFQQMNDEDIAENIGCDRTTVTRQRKRLLTRLEIMFFGADALR